MSHERLVSGLCLCFTWPHMCYARAYADFSWCAATVPLAPGTGRQHRPMGGRRRRHWARACPYMCSACAYAIPLVHPWCAPGNRNRAATEIYGWSEEEALGQNVLTVLPAANQNLHDMGPEVIQKLVKGQRWQGEWAILTKHDKTVNVMVSGKKGPSSASMTRV